VVRRQPADAIAHAARPPTVGLHVENLDQLRVSNREIALLDSGEVADGARPERLERARRRLRCSGIDRNRFVFGRR
jgi:hypothetical protein